MLGMAVLATAPTSGGVDDAVNALMAVGVSRGGERRQWRPRGHQLGGAAGDSGVTAAAATTITVMTALTTSIAERVWMMHHWTMVGGRGSGGRVMMRRITQFFP